MEILNELVYKNKGQEAYFQVINNKNKQWLFKNNALKTGLQLYQPTAIKGILFKNIFPYVKNLECLYKYIGVKKVQIDFNKDIKEYLNQIFGQNYDTSFFGGTPSEDQKVIIQISQNGVVLGYCKVTISPKVAKLFDRECKCLNSLERNGITNIPQVLGRENLGEYEVFCQSNIKSDKAKCGKRFNKLHRDFLMELFHKTKKICLFEQSNYYNKLKKFKTRILKNSEIKLIPIICAIELIEKEYNNQIFEFGFYHGDFTPWNIAIDERRLKVFDFEYSEESYPPYLDAFHFFLQTEFFIKKRDNVDEILNDFRKFKKKISCFNIDIDKYFIMYLLEIINLYLSRIEMKDEIDIKHNNLRIVILRRMMENYENKNSN